MFGHIDGAEVFGGFFNSLRSSAQRGDSGPFAWIVRAVARAVTKPTPASKRRQRSSPTNTLPKVGVRRIDDIYVACTE
jgi:hypothetical protein